MKRHICTALTAMTAAATAAWPALGSAPQASTPGDDRPPIIDVHLHAFPIELYGPGFVEPSPSVLEFGFEVAPTDADNLEQTLAALREHNIVKAVVSGPPELTRRWVDADPERMIPGIDLGDPDPLTGPTLEELPADRIGEEIEAGRLAVLGEVATQYAGIRPDDERLEPYFRVAEDHDIPVHIHTAGVGAPTARFRSAMGRPLTLEPVLVRHPRLRVYLENAGYPFQDDMLALLFQYGERVYVDVSTLIRIVPRTEFYRYLKVLVDAGFAGRIMFGSDQVLWPQTIGFSIRVIEEAPFLTPEQKRDIFYNNAVRFFRLDASQ